MREIINYTLLGLLLIVLGVIIISCSSNPLRKSEEQIRENILELTPTGTSMEDVLELIESKEGWKTMWVNNEHGNDHTNLSRDYIIGEKSIKAYIGKYPGFFTRHIEVYWGFDEKSKLIEVGIRKTSDSF